MPTEVHIVKAVVFPVVMYVCGTIKKLSAKVVMLSTCDAGKDLRVPCIARRSNQSILKEINPEYSLEGLMVKLKLLGHLMPRVNSLEQSLMLGKIRVRGEGVTEDKMVGWCR